MRVTDRSDRTADSAAPRSGLLSLRDVSVALRTQEQWVTVVENLDLDVQPGEVVGLVGESGSGKSVTAAAVLGLLPGGGRITAGSVRFGDLELTTASPRALRWLRGSQIALISQEPTASLDPVFTVGQQLDELVRCHHGGARKAVRTRSLELLEQVSLREPQRVAQSYPHELSGGMAQRVAIALALSGQPKLLIADEPTTALDVTVQSAILELLRELQADLGMSILLITHNWSVVASVCRRTYVMYAGHVMESCAIGQMIRGPLHPYTVGLLDSLPQRTPQGQRLQAIPGSVPSPATWPVGCHFAPRCRFATDECRRAPIPLLEPKPGRLTRCLHHDELTAERADD